MSGPLKRSKDINGNINWVDSDPWGRGGDDGNKPEDFLMYPEELDQIIKDAKASLVKRIIDAIEAIGKA